MKALLTNLVSAVVIALLVNQPAAFSQVASNVSPPNQLSRDLAPFPDFFQEGLKKRDEEIQRLIRQPNTSVEPPLNNTVNPEVELERLPQLKPSDFPAPAQVGIVPQSQQD